jgi:hypothetical protein
MPAQTRLWRDIGVALALLVCVAATPVRGADPVHQFSFKGVICEHRLTLKELGADWPGKWPGDWSGYSYLVMEMRASTPQRFALWVYTADGPRRIEIQPFGQNVWLRASIALKYFVGMDQSGNDLASTINRRTNSFWMSVWGPFGDLKSVQAIGIAMQYPINNPVIEIRSMHLSKTDEGSEFLQKGPLLDPFGQWALADWPRKIHSAAQLKEELAEEQKTLGGRADYGYGKYNGYLNTHVKATGFFRVQQIDGVWWLIDPDGHYFLSTGSNGVGGFGGFGRRSSAAANGLTDRRLDAWGMTTGGAGRPDTVFLRWPRNPQTTFLGLPDVYASDFAAEIDRAADRQCTPRKNDPLIIGYFIGNEPPWGGRESQVVDMILAGPETATQARLKAYLAAGDTPTRRRAFVVAAFEKYLSVICAAVRKYDPHHLILGIRFGGNPPAADILRTGRIFDVCSINVYEYEPTKQVERAYRLTGRPVLIGEFHIGVPADGLGAGLVQAMNQKQRAIGYRYYVEQAMSLPCCVGAHWFTWRDEPVLGRMDGENYNIGLVDVTNRPYPQLIDAIKATNHDLFQVHAGDELPFNQRPMASEAGTPSSPWDLP